MNFFGHATVALARDADPRFLLGAMLPDLAGMAGSRLGSVADPRVAAGVAHHHAVDRRFHAHEGFVALCSAALRELTEAGCERAPARAVGHVGSELLLDGLLGRAAHARAAYRDALALAAEGETLAAVEWLRGPADGVLQVSRRLQAAPLPQAYADPAFVADRLEWILARRPRLALRPADRAPVLHWLEGAQRTLEALHPTLLRDLDA